MAVSNSAGLSSVLNVFLTVITPLPSPASSRPDRHSGDQYYVHCRCQWNSAARYQWRLNGAHLVGQTATSLTLVNVQAAQAGVYSVIVSNAMGTVTSSNAALTVLTRPLITVQPSPQAVNESETVTFRVTATGTQPLSYRWRFNGSDLNNGGAISGATSATLILANVQPAHAAIIQWSQNVAGVATSSSALLESPPRCLWGMLGGALSAGTPGGGAVEPQTM